MSINIDKLLLRIAKERAVADAQANVTPAASIVRDKSANEQNAVYHPQGYSSFFCIHDKHKFGPCVHCRRSQVDADALRSKLMTA